MLVDAFLFFNELDLLEIRLTELAPYVDRFVLVECTWTHQNQPKPLHYLENKKRFAPWARKIQHVVVSDRPERKTPEVMEPFHRNCLVRGCEDCDPNDTVMISDLDEIPSPEAILAYQRDPQPCMCFEQAMYYYWVNCFHNQCTGTRICSVDYARRMTPQRIRHHPTPLVALRKDGESNWGGWHFSYLGGADAIREKTAAFCHPGCADAKFMNDANVRQCLATGEDLYHRGGNPRFVEIDETWPKAIRETPERFLHLIKPWTKETTHETDSRRD